MKKFLQLSMILALLANTALKAQADFALEFNGVDQRGAFVISQSPSNFVQQ